MLRSMGCARWSHRRSWASAPVLGALLHLAACLHGEAPPRGPSSSVATGIDTDRASVAPADSTKALTSVFGGSPGQVLAVAERSAPGDVEPVPTPRRHLSFEDEAATAKNKKNKKKKKSKTSKKNNKTKKTVEVSEGVGDGGRETELRLSEAGRGSARDTDASGDGARARATPAPISAREIPGPPTSMQTVLGSTRRRIEARLVSDGVDGDDGWVHYGVGLAIRYESRRAAEVAIRVPAGLSCAESARWAGFLRAMPPLYRVGGCAWPGLSARHRLHRGVIGELARTTGILQIWSTKKESP